MEYFNFFNIFNVSEIRIYPYKRLHVTWVAISSFSFGVWKQHLLLYSPGLPNALSEPAYLELRVTPISSVLVGFPVLPHIMALFKNKTKTFSMKKIMKFYSSFSKK